MSLGMSLIPVGDAIAKYLSGATEHSAIFLAWSRFIVGGSVALPLAWMHRHSGTYSPNFVFKHCVRGLCISMTLVLIIQALSLSPIADVFGAFFIGPSFAVVLSVVWLKERVTGLEWLSVIFGFVGVLMVIQPVGTISPGLPWAFAAGLCYGGFLTATRWAAGSGPPITQLAIQLIFGSVFLMPFAIQDLSIIQAEFAPLILIMGLSSTLANFFSIMALNRARPAFLAPIVYLQVVVATLLGLFYFGDTLNTLAALGIGLIVFTGLLKIRI